MRKFFPFRLIALLAIISLGLYLYSTQAPRRTLIGINYWTGYDPLLLAEEKNLFAKNNADVKIIPFTSTIDEIQAFKDGKIDAAGLTLDEAFSLINTGYPGKIVLILDFSKGGDMIIGKPHIHSISELKGNRVGYEGTVVGEFLLQRALQSYYLKKKDIQLINVPAENWLTSFKNNELDALVCFNPTASILLNEHAGSLLFSSNDIPFEIIDVLMFSDDYFKHHKKQIKNILRSWFEALDFLEQDLDSAATLIAKRKNISPATYKEGIGGLSAPNLEANKKLLGLHTKENIHKYSQNIITFMLSKGLLNSRISTLDVFDASLVNELEKQ